MTGVLLNRKRWWGLIGAAKMTQVTLGFQWDGQASAATVTLGASADIAYEIGVAVYTLTKGGLKYQTSLGRLKFNYLPSDIPSDNEQSMGCINLQNGIFHVQINCF